VRDHDVAAHDTAAEETDARQSDVNRVYRDRATRDAVPREDLLVQHDANPRQIEQNRIRRRIDRDDQADPE
jgi:hypothetical protein